MSIVLVCFSNAPKVSDEAMRKDSELDKYLESRVEGKKDAFFFFFFFKKKQKYYSLFVKSFKTSYRFWTKNPLFRNEKGEN